MTWASRWFSPGTPVSSTNTTDRHDITEILLKVALNTITHKPIKAVFISTWILHGVIFHMIYIGLCNIHLYVILTNADSNITYLQYSDTTPASTSISIISIPHDEEKIL